MRLGVGAPWSSPFIWSKFSLNFARMLARFDRVGWEVEPFLGRGIDPAARHVDLCLQALDWDADVICIIGADQIHPEDMLNRLVDRYEETGGDIISALVPFRGYVSWQEMKPFQPMGWQLKSEGLRECRGMTQDPDMFVPIDPANGEMQRVDVIGSGVLMFHRDYILSLEPPWFYYKVDPVTMQRVADMDTRFVWRLRSEAQARIWVDTTIKVTHLHPFEIDDTFRHRFADWAEDGAGDEEIFRREPVIIGGHEDIGEKDER